MKNACNEEIDELNSIEYIPFSTCAKLKIG